MIINPKNRNLSSSFKAKRIFFETKKNWEKNSDRKSSEKKNSNKRKFQVLKFSNPPRPTTIPFSSYSNIVLIKYPLIDEEFADNFESV